MVYHASDKGDISEIILFHCMATPPKAGPLDIHTDEILFRMCFRKPYGIFTFPASKFKNDRI